MIGHGGRGEDRSLAQQREVKRKRKYGYYGLLIFKRKKE